MDIKDKEVYENIISLLKRGLEIYADEKNYETKDNKLSAINMDSGENARFTLKQVNKILENIESLDNEYDNLMKQIEKNEISPQDILSKIKNLTDEKFNN